MSTPEQAAAAVRQANARSCLLVLRAAGEPITLAELAAETGLSRPTVEAVLRDLEGIAPVHPLPPAVTAPGRPARRFEFDAGFGLAAGLDVGLHSVRVLVADCEGSILVHTTIPLHAEGDGSGAGDRRLRSVASALRDAVIEAGQSPDRLRGVGVAIPGILDGDDHVRRSLALPEWAGLDVAHRLGTEFGCPVAVENDLRLAAHAERHLGAGVRPDGSTIDQLLLLQIGHRISVSLIVNGEVLQGSHRIAGELGSLRGMRWTATANRHGELVWSTGANAQILFQRAASGDEKAVAEIATFCAEIAPRVATLALTVDPETIVIGGGLSLAGRAFLGPLQRAVHRLLMVEGKPELVASHLNAEGAVAGALGLAFERWSQPLFGVPAMPPPWSAWGTRLAPRSALPTSANERQT
jgi:predicted NBD/HSP70 family sugar kinase